MPVHIGRWRWLGVGVLALAALGLASMVFRFDTRSVPSPAATSSADPSAPFASAAPAPSPDEAAPRRPRAPRQPVNLPPGGISRMRVSRGPSRDATGSLRAPPHALATDPRAPPHALATDPRARREQMLSRLDELSQERGWSANKTATIEELLRETLDGAEERLAGITEPSQWAEARREVVRFRQTQALRIAEELGDEDYRAFVDEMRLARIPSPTGQPGVRWMPLRIKDVE